MCALCACVLDGVCVYLCGFVLDGVYGGVYIGVLCACLLDGVCGGDGGCMCVCVCVLDGV